MTAPPHSASTPGQPTGPTPRFRRLPDGIAGYVFNADLYCPDHIAGVYDPHMPETTDPRATEDVLDRLAAHSGIHRDQEDTYDSGEFPKILYDFETADDATCGLCRTLLRD